MLKVQGGTKHCLAVKVEVDMTNESKSEIESELLKVQGGSKHCLAVKVEEQRLPSRTE